MDFGFVTLRIPRWLVRLHWQIMATSTNPALSQKAQIKLIQMGDR